jgi:hypothetical protein
MDEETLTAAAKKCLKHQTYTEIYETFVALFLVIDYRNQYHQPK